MKIEINSMQRTIGASLATAALVAALGVGGASAAPGSAGGESRQTSWGRSSQPNALAGQKAVRSSHGRRIQVSLHAVRVSNAPGASIGAIWIAGKNVTRNTQGRHLRRGHVVIQRSGGAHSFSTAQ